MTPVCSTTSFFRAKPTTVPAEQASPVVQKMHPFVTCLQRLGKEIIPHSSSGKHDPPHSSHYRLATLLASLRSVCTTPPTVERVPTATAARAVIFHAIANDRHGVPRPVYPCPLPLPPLTPSPCAGFSPDPPPPPPPSLRPKGMTLEAYDEMKARKPAGKRSPEVTEETRKKISTRLKAKWREPAYRERRKMVMPNRLGIKHSDETKARISASVKEKWTDPAYREKVSGGEQGGRGGGSIPGGGRQAACVGAGDRTRDAHDHPCSGVSCPLGTIRALF